MGQLAPDLEEGRELHRRRLAHGAPEHRPLHRRIEIAPLVDDAGDHLPGPRTAERLLLRLGIEAVQQVRAHLDVEQDFGRDAVGRAPGEPVLRIDADLKMDEAGRQRRRHPVDHAAVALAVAARDQRGAVGQLVLAHLAVEHQLVERGLHHRDGRGQLFQVDEPAAGIAGGRQEGRRRPAGAAVGVAPGDAPEIDGVQQQRAHVEILAARASGDLLGEGALGAARSAPQDRGLARFDQQRQGRREFARAQRVVGGYGFGIGHRRPPDRRNRRAGSLPGPGTSPGRQRHSAHRVGRHEGDAGSRLEAQCGPPGSGAVQAGRIVMLGGGRGDAGQLRQLNAGGRERVADAALGLRVAAVKVRSELGRPPQVRRR